MKRPVIVKGRAKLIFTDHFAIILRMKNIPLAGRTMENVVRWNLQKEVGLQSYKELADANSDTLLGEINEYTCAEEDMTSFNRISNDAKFKNFGKVSLKKRKVNKSSKSNNLSQEKEAQKLMRLQTEKAEKEILKLKEAG